MPLVSSSIKFCNCRTIHLYVCLSAWLSICPSVCSSLSVFSSLFLSQSKRKKIDQCLTECRTTAISSGSRTPYYSSRTYETSGSWSTSRTIDANGSLSSWRSGVSCVALLSSWSCWSRRPYMNRQKHYSAQSTNDPSEWKMYEKEWNIYSRKIEIIIVAIISTTIIVTKSIISINFILVSSW